MEILLGHIITIQTPGKRKPKEHSIIIQIANKLGLKDRYILDKITSEPPKEKSYGDISTNLALIGSKILNKTPHNLADEIIKELLKLKIIHLIQKKCQHQYIINNRN